MNIFHRIRNLIIRPRPTPAPQRVAVESSVIKSVLFNGGVLEVQFNSGRVYQYFDVSEADYQSLVTAPSVGRYFNAYIKNDHAFTEISQ